MRNLLGGVLFFALCASPAHAAPILWSDNGHYYDFITGSRSWAQALTRAGDGAVEGTWRWNAGPENGSLLTYTNWKSGEPNNALGFFEEDQAFANYSGVGLWNDWAGFAPANFVVEYSPPPPVATPEPATLGLLAAGLAGIAPRLRRARS